MDFAKYVSMLYNGGLYFPRADQLADPFEGSYARANVRFRGASAIPSDAQEQLSKFYKQALQWTYVNCWHMNEHESAGMWNIYAKSDRSIAIQSTYERLRDSLSCHSDVYVGVVNYIDYDSQPLPEGNSFYAFVHKRKSFEHERELRAVIQDLPTAAGGGVDWQASTPLGLWRSVQLNDVLEAVYVSPRSPAWFAGVVEVVSAKFQLEVNVLQSKLDEQPFY